MLDETAEVFAELMRNKEHRVTSGNPAWEASQANGVFAELRQLAEPLGADVVNTNGSIYLIPVDETSPLLTNRADVTDFMQSRRALANAEHRWLLNYICLRFMTYFFDPKSRDGSTGATFVTVNEFIERIDADCQLADSGGEEFSDQFKRLAASWRDRIHHNRGDENEQVEERSNSMTKTGIVNTAFSWLDANGLATQVGDEVKRWMPTQRMRDLMPVTCDDARYERIVEYLEGNRIQG